MGGTPVQKASSVCAWRRGGDDDETLEIVSAHDDGDHFGDF